MHLSLLLAVCMVCLLTGCGQSAEPELKAPTVKVQKLPVISLNQVGSQKVVSWPKTISVENEQGNFEFQTELEGNFGGDSVTVHLEFTNSEGTTVGSSVVIARKVEEKYPVVLPFGSLGGNPVNFHLKLRCKDDEYSQSGAVEIK